MGSASTTIELYMAANPTLPRWASKGYVFAAKFAIGLALSPNP